MRLYATSPARRARQVAGDGFILVWVVGWILVGRWVFGLVMTLAAPADPLRRAGTSLSDRMTDIADRVTQIPLLGDGVGTPFAGTAAVGADLVAAGDRLDSSVRTVAWVVSLLSAGTPILLALLAWVLVRSVWVRRAAALGPDVADPESQQLLALRALVHQHPRVLQRLYPDPVAAYSSGDPEVWRRLADLELAELGLRSGRPVP